METTETYGAALAATSWAPSKDETSWGKNIMTAIDDKAVTAMIDEAYSSKGIAQGVLSKTVGKVGAASAVLSANDIYQDLAGYKYNDVMTEYKAAAIDAGAVGLNFGAGVVAGRAIGYAVTGIAVAAAAPEIVAVGAGLVAGAVIGYGVDKFSDYIKEQFCGKPNDGR